MGGLRTVFFVAGLALGCAGRAAYEGSGAEGGSTGTGVSSGSVTSGATTAVPTEASVDDDSGDAQVATECPLTVPSLGSACGGNLKCPYGWDGGLTNGLYCVSGECANGRWFGLSPCSLEASAPYTSADGMGGPDAGSDASPSCGPPPAGCARIENATPCEPGFICDPSQGCAPSECSCGLFSKAGTWACSADCGGGVCVATDAAALGVTCPAVPPRVGNPCAGPIACPYAPACGAELFVCGGAPPLWSVTAYEECSDGCPPFEPSMADGCSAKGMCSYTSSCGGSDTAQCNGLEVVEVQIGVCPP
jgi:hypothetical protein